jgi:signal transduction histidine kinase
MKKIPILIASLLWCLNIYPAFTQPQGDYFIRNFTSYEIKASDWIQSITQDSRGIIYAGNNLGTILEYDGSRWRTISATNGPIRALKADASGRVYVGSFGDFGYLSPNEKGGMQYVSLINQIPEEHRNFSDIWSIEFFGRDIYFRSVERLFRYRDGQIQPFVNEFGWFGNLIVLDDRLFVTLDYNKIILELKGDSLVKFYETDELEKVAFGASAYYSKGRKLVGSWGGGLFVFCPENINKPGRKVFERLTTNEALTNSRLLNVAEVYPVKPGIFAARTSDGITVFRENGYEIAFISSANGLNSSLVETAFADKNQLLWIGTEKGITRVDISSPMTTWYSMSDKTGTVWGIISYNNTIYFWGINGIYRLEGKNPVKFQDQTYGLVEFDEPGMKSRSRLLAINSDALVEIRNNRLHKLIEFPERLLYQQIFLSRLHPGSIYLYGANGLYLISYKNGNWNWDGNIAGINQGIQSLAEDDNGDLWLAVGNNRKLIRLMPHNTDTAIEQPVTYLKQLYSPSADVSERWIKCFTAGNRAIFGTDKGLFRFDQSRNRFVHDSIFGQRFTDGFHAVYILKEGKDGTAFISDRVHRSDDVGLSIRQPDGSYRWYNRPFLAWTPHIRIYDACFDSSGNVWMVTDEGINKFSPSLDIRIPGKFNTLIREVATRKDSVLYLGNYPLNHSTKLSNKLNFMKFTYSALSFEGEDQNVYSYFLDGFDNEWSRWTPEVIKEYNYLPPGDYTFRVKARNIYGIESDEATYIFSILPPWYRTIWAYVLYGIILVVLVYLVVVFNLRRLRKANILLEKAVEERTEEILRQKEEIAEINENLLVKQEELRATVDTLYDMQEHLIKSEKMANLGQLIAGIAHEINSPLGAIKASVSDIANNSREILFELPELVRKLNESEFELFIELVNRSCLKSVPSNSRDERLFKRTLQKKLEEENLPDAENKADTLVDMGIHENVDPFLSILGNGRTNSLQVAYNLSQLMKNSRNIEIAAERASRMVQALKHYSHNTARDEKTESNITEGLLTVLTLFQNQFKYKIQLETEFEPIPMILCYPDELNQVWTNLITNAVDAMDGKGKLSISVTRAGEWIIVKVADTGKGIPESIQPRIFDTFFSTKPAGEGSGLGLFITKEIIDRHGGKIVFETDPGKGTTFIISLPVITRAHKN